MKKGDSLVNRFRRRQQDNLVDEIRLNGWSIILLIYKIREEEKRLQDSDVAVEADSDVFWVHM